MKVTWSLTFWFVKSKVSNKAISELDEKHTDLKLLTEESPSYSPPFPCVQPGKFIWLR